MAHKDFHSNSAGRLSTQQDQSIANRSRAATQKSAAPSQWRRRCRLIWRTVAEKRNLRLPWIDPPSKVALHYDAASPLRQTLVTQHRVYR
jgi:hypothetical protein